MGNVKVAVVKKGGVKFIFVDIGRFDPMTGNMEMNSETRAILTDKYSGLPVLIRATSIIGNAPSYSGDTNLIEYVRGTPLDAFRWKELSSSRKWWQFWST